MAMSWRWGIAWATIAITAMPSTTRGNIIVSGKSLGIRGIGLPDILTAKYSQTGKFLWAKRFFVGDYAHEEGRAVGTDAAGNVYVAGIASSKTNTLQDAVLIKYSPNGEENWARTYDAPFHDNGRYFALAVDKNGAALLTWLFFVAVDKSDNIYVSGFSLGNAKSAEDFVTIKYAP